MDQHRYNNYSVHEKINVRSYLEAHKQLSSLGRRCKVPYYRAMRPYKENTFGFWKKDIPFVSENNRLTKEERFEFKF